MNCCQCQGIEELFNQKFVNKELSRYRSKGPDRTTRMLVEAIEEAGVSGLSLLDIGGGVGAIQYELLDSGVERATSVDASAAYLQAARSEAQRRGFSDRLTYLHGNFVTLAEKVAPADIVTLDRVICCYDDMEKLVDLSAARAGKLYGLVYPRDAWWLKLGLGIMNVYFRLRKNPYRGFVHPTRAVDAIIKKKGFKRSYYRQTLAWQVVVYSR